MAYNNNGDQSSTEAEDPMAFNAKKPYELEKWAQQSMKDFSALLESIEGVDIKLKTLWKQIYDNAITDRKNAYLVWTDLYINVHGEEEMHFKHGATITKYMERMEKANEQILKLASLVEKAKIKTDEEDLPTADDLFARNESKFKNDKKK